MTTNNNRTVPVSLDALAVGRSSTNAFLTVLETRNPNSGDVNYLPQQRWFNTATESEWILTGFSVVANVKTAIWQPINISAIAATEFLSGNSGGLVGVDSNNNINVVGDGTTITIAGNPSTHTLTASLPSTFYSMGTFTPTLAFGGASVGITYSTQIGEYTRIGNVVFIQITLVLTSKGSSTGNATIQTLPISSGGSSFNDMGLNVANVTLTSGESYAYTHIFPAGSIIQIFQAGTGGVTLTDANCANNTVLTVYGSYFTS
jgi:hypothetical protein